MKKGIHLFKTPDANIYHLNNVKNKLTGSEDLGIVFFDKDEITFLKALSSLDNLAEQESPILGPFFHILTKCINQSLKKSKT